MNNTLEKNGWALDGYKLPKETIEKLVQRKNEFLKISTEEVNRAFNISLTGFDEKYVEQIELIKGITRSFLRYDPGSHLMLQSVWKSLRDDLDLGQKIQYVTLPYPIVHLALD